MTSIASGRPLDPWIDGDLARARPGIGQQAAATAHPLASRAALVILRQGGSAVDAAIAAQAVLTAVEPNASGIGGGAMVLVADEGGAVRAFDGLAASPARVTDRLARDFDGRTVPADRAAFGGRTVGVPGALRALELAHARHGKLTWATLFEPAIALCEDGYPLSPYLLRVLRENPQIATEPMTRALFCTEGGTPHPAGHTIRNPALARTLRRIADQGADALYQGELARDLCRTVTEDLFPGTLTEADLRDYTAIQRTPCQFRHGSTAVLGSPLPTFGAIAVGQLLGVAARHGVTDIGAEPTAQQIHILIEACRLAFADRAAYAGDPDLHTIDEIALLAPDYLDTRAAMLDPARRSANLHARLTRDGSMTSHLSIADATGVVVSMTTTINQNFGARLSVGGFYLNNVMTNFADHPNEGSKRSNTAMAPQSRPRTSIAPCIVFDKQGVLASLGAGGGGRIIGYVANALLRLAAGERDPQAILSAPHAINSAGIAELEPPLDQHAKALAAMGHWGTPRRHDGGAQAIIRHDNGWSAGADPRRDGVGMAANT